MPCGLLQASPWSRPPRRRHSIDHLSIIRKEPRMSDANDEYVYDEASGEWLPAVEAAAKAAAADLVEVLDSAGNILADGDSVITLRDMKVKGAGQALRKGTVITALRLTGDPQDIERRYEGRKGPDLRT